MALEPSELSAIKSKLGNQSSALVTTVARLYICPPNARDWSFSGIQGGIQLVIDRSHPAKPYKILIWDLETMECKFDEELYENMEYNILCPFFHAFECSMGIIGLSFCDPMKAKTFYNKVTSNIPAAGSSKGMSLGRNRGASDAKKAGFWSRVKNVFIGNEDDEIEEIGTPTGFVHRQHIGYDPDKGFEVRDIPDQWKGLFKKVGIKKKDLKNPETAKIIFNTVQQHMGKENAAPAQKPPTVHGNAPPPPPMSFGGSAPPPPPMDFGAITPSGPPPPPNTLARPAPPAPVHRNTQDHLLAISQGIKLKKVEAKDDDVALPQLSTSDEMGMQDALRAAMLNRRPAFEEEEEVDDEDDGGWSD